MADMRERRLAVWARRIFGRRIDPAATDFDEALRWVQALDWDAALARKRLRAAYDVLGTVAKNAYREASRRGEPKAIEVLDAAHEDLVRRTLRIVEEIRDELERLGYDPSELRMDGPGEGEARDPGRPSSHPDGPAADATPASNVSRTVPPAPSDEGGLPDVGLGRPNQPPQ
jgi:hypothetical protein